MSEKASNLLNHHLTRIIIAIIIAVVVHALLSTSELSNQGRSALAITVLMAILWITEAIPIAVTALLPIGLFPIFGVMASSKVTPNYGNHLIFLFLGGFMLAAAIERWNLHRRFALTTILLLGTKPDRLILGFMAATAFLSMWISNTATALMMLPIGIAAVKFICREQTTGEITHRFGVLLMLSIAYSASVGGIATLVGTPPNIVLAGLLPKLFDTPLSISFSEWLMVGLPFSVLFLLIIWVYLTKFQFKKTLATLPIIESRQIIRNTLKEMGPLAKAEKRVLTLFIATALLWIFRTPITLGGFYIPGWSTLMPYGTFFHDTTVAILAGILLMILPAGNKEKDRLLDWQWFQQQAPWGILILFGGGFAIGAGLTETQTTTWLADQLLPLKHFHPIILILVICLLITFMTEVTSNTATANVMLPIIGSIAVALDVHPFLLMIPATISASCAFMLPVATPPNAIIFGSGWISIKEMSKYGLFLNLLGAILVTLFVYFLARPILGM